MGKTTKTVGQICGQRSLLRTMLQSGVAVTAPLLLWVAGAAASEAMHASIEKYEGSKTCLECHDTMGKEVTESLHYRGRGNVTNLVGGAPGQEYGFVAGSCIPGITSAGSNWLTLAQAKGKEGVAAGCAVCHAGAGRKPGEKLGEADEANIDCLICHGPDYKRTVVKDAGGFKIVPAAGVDPLKTAQKAQKPTAEMCLRCHVGAGGGPNYKHGTIPTSDTDVHYSMGMNCTECHTTKKHRVGGSADLRVQDAPDVKVACVNCHGTTPHAGKSDKQKEDAAILNRHAERLACQSCHVPAIARESAMPTMVEQDWSKPQRDPLTGLFLPFTKTATNVRPEFYWWNRTSRPNGEPVGAKMAPESKVSPWKKVTYTLIADEASGKSLNLNLATYWTTGDVAAAAKKGAEDAKQSYSGKWKPVQETYYYSVNHQVAPKGEAHKCGDCHSPDGLIDFKALKRQRL
jgi:cytochrome c/cytochrome c3-like protein